MTDPRTGASAPDRLEIERLVVAPVTDVWTAWTTAEGLSRWWWSGWQDTTYSVDLSVGGSYRIEAPTAGIAVTGTYLTIDEPHRFVATWVWSDDDGDGPVERITVTFDPVADGTRVRVEHTGPWTTSQPAEQYRVGWRHVLDALASSYRTP